MPIHVYWYDDSKRILRYDFVENWTREDLLAATEIIFAHLDSVQHAVDSIIDLRKNTTSPVRIWLTLAFRDAPYLNARVHPNHRLNVVVGADTAMRIVLNVAASVIPHALATLHFASSIAAARAIIKEHSTDE